MIKTNGAEFRRYLVDDAAWPEGTWHDDEFITVDGVEWVWEADIESIPDNAILSLTGGVVCGLPGDLMPSMESHFKKWRKSQTTTTILVECDLSKLGDVKAAVKVAGGKIV